ncbi:hypothetical protein [Saccharopolyspora pogona]|nr:hypothetical protein [Saccharopolyspora pogona]
MVANQVWIFALRPEVRGRLNAASMTCAFLGGSSFPGSGYTPTRN